MNICKYICTSVIDLKILDVNHKPERRNMGGKSVGNGVMLKYAGEYGEYCEAGDASCRSGIVMKQHCCTAFDESRR